MVKLSWLTNAVKFLPKIGRWIVKAAKWTARVPGRVWRRTHIPKTKGKYASEFYYGKGFDIDMVTFPLMLGVWTQSVITSAWKHQWGWIAAMIFIYVYSGWFGIKMYKRYKK